MIWAVGVALILVGVLLIIYAVQGKWPIAPLQHVAPAPESVNPPSTTSGKPAERVKR